MIAFLSEEFCFSEFDELIEVSLLPVLFPEFDGLLGVSLLPVLFPVLIKSFLVKIEGSKFKFFSVKLISYHYHSHHQIILNFDLYLMEFFCLGLLFSFED